MKSTDLQISTILLGRKSIRKVYVDALKCDVGVRVLSESDADGAKLRAADYCRKCKVDLDIDPEFYDREIKRQIIWLAFYDADKLADPAEPFFPADNDVRSLDSVVLDQLFNVYLELLDEVIPMRRLDEKGVGELVVALKKEQEETGTMESLRLIAPDTLRVCVRTLVAMQPAT